MKFVNGMLEPMAQRVVHWSQRGFVKGRQITANVVHVEAAVEGYLHDEDAEPAAVFLDIAAAFPAVEWSYMHWALCRMGVPEGQVDAIFRRYGSAFTHIVWQCGVSVRLAWQSFPLGAGLLAVFADDSRCSPH